MIRMGKSIRYKIGLKVLVSAVSIYMYLHLYFSEHGGAICYSVIGFICQDFRKQRFDRMLFQLYKMFCKEFPF